MQYADHMDDIFDELTDLTTLQRHSIKERYRFLMTEYRYRCRLYAVLFYMFRITMTVGSLAVPALLSIQSGSSAPSYMYWLTWGVSLAVTTSNGVMTLFKLDKRFFSLHATAERLRSETWQFVQLAGRYSGHHGTTKPSHANQFVYYCSQLEKINMARVDDEYIKAGDDSTKTPAPTRPADPTAKPTGDTMVPSPADQSNLNTPIRDSISLVEDDDGQTPKPTTSIARKKNTSVLPLSIHQESPASTSKKSIALPSANPVPAAAAAATATATAATAANPIEVSVSGSQEPAVLPVSATTVVVL
jgi:hypothetical protein